MAAPVRLTKRRGWHWVLISLPKRIIKLVFFPKGVPLIPAVPHRPRWAERLTGKRVRLYLPTFTMRYSLAINFPLHRKYYGIIFQSWHYYEFNGDYTAWATDLLISSLEEFLGYSEEEFWFDVIVGDGWQIWDFIPENIDKWEIRVEDEYGVTLQMWRGEVPLEFKQKPED